MSPIEAPPIEPVSPERLAEASVWIAKLHGDARGRAIEDGLRRWLQAHPGERSRLRAGHRGLGGRGAAAPRRAFSSATSCRISPALGRDGDGAGLHAGVGASSESFWLQNVGVVCHCGWGAAPAGTRRRHSRFFSNTDTRLVVKYDEQDASRRAASRRSVVQCRQAQRLAVHRDGGRSPGQSARYFLCGAQGCRASGGRCWWKVACSVSPVLPALPRADSANHRCARCDRATPATAAFDAQGRRRNSSLRRVNDSRFEHSARSTRLDTPSIGEDDGMASRPGDPRRHAVAGRRDRDESIQRAMLIVVDP